MSKSKLQLVGVTSMLLASKYEEMYAPETNDFVYITDNAYTKSDIHKMECLILKSLDFNLGRPLPLHFLRRNSKAGEVMDLGVCLVWGEGAVSLVCSISFGIRVVVNNDFYRGNFFCGVLYLTFVLVQLFMCPLAW